jgi:hypothetical protein
LNVRAAFATVSLVVAPVVSSLVAVLSLAGGCSSTSTGVGGTAEMDAAGSDDTNRADAGTAADAGFDATVSDSGVPSGADATAGDVAVADAAGDVAADAPVGCDADPDMPGDLSCTGLYSDWATKTISPGAVPYTPGLVFWSDGAEKSRWIQLPAGSKIDTSDMDDWVFPTGTKIWKQFSLAGQVVETRLIWKQASGWVFLDYRWAADGTAPRLDEGETNVNGTTYEIPATSICPDCHAGRPDVVLGIDLLGAGVSTAQGVTLATLVQGNSLTHPPPSTTVTIPEDSTGKAAAALGWLHVNCGTSCHNAEPNAQALATRLFMKLTAAELYPDGGTARVSQLDTYKTAVNVAANLMPNGVSYERIAPGDAGASLLPLMAAARDSDAGFKSMPPIVSHIPDTAGLALVTAWIDALGGADAGTDAVLDAGK